MRSSLEAAVFDRLCANVAGGLPCGLAMETHNEDMISVIRSRAWGLSGVVVNTVSAADFGAQCKVVVGTFREGVAGFVWVVVVVNEENGDGSLVIACLREGVEDCRDAVVGGEEGNGECVSVSIDSEFELQLQGGASCRYSVVEGVPM